jgi:hypothetical protein
MTILNDQFLHHFSHFTDNSVYIWFTVKIEAVGFRYTQRKKLKDVGVQININFGSPFRSESNQWSVTSHPLLLSFLKFVVWGSNKASPIWYWLIPPPKPHHVVGTSVLNLTSITVFSRWSTAVKQAAAHILQECDMYSWNKRRTNKYCKVLGGIRGQQINLINPCHNGC